MILINKIKCNKCGDIIVSEHQHDYRTCKCGACAVDGGFMYLKRVGNQEDWTEMSRTQEFEWEKLVDELYDKMSYKDENLIAISEKDLRILIHNLQQCALGWAYTSYRLHK